MFNVSDEFIPKDKARDLTSTFSVDASVSELGKKIPFPSRSSTCMQSRAHKFL